MSILNKISGFFGAKNEDEGTMGDVTGGDTMNQPTTEPAGTEDPVVPTEEPETTPMPEATPEPDVVMPEAPQAPEGETSEGGEDKPTDGMTM
ncbi:MAG: hypothetical protein K9M15_00780 [Candidatus Marinimicrobia bacterium]|nr:hypothetical protein [Candidatus Neomarinimicrobiota bacterium]